MLDGTRGGYLYTAICPCDRSLIGISLETAGTSTPATARATLSEQLQYRLQLAGRGIPQRLLVAWGGCRAGAECSFHMHAPRVDHIECSLCTTPQYNISWAHEWTGLFRWIGRGVGGVAWRGGGVAGRGSGARGVAERALCSRDVCIALWWVAPVRYDSALHHPGDYSTRARD